MAFNFKSPKDSMKELRESKLSITARLAITFAVLAAGASFFAYTQYQGAEQAKAQVKTLNGQIMELDAKSKQMAELQQKLADTAANQSQLTADLAENKDLLRQASEALEKCSCKAPKKDVKALVSPAPKQ